MICAGTSWVIKPSATGHFAGPMNTRVLEGDELLFRLASWFQGCLCTAVPGAVNTGKYVGEVWRAERLHFVDRAIRATLLIPVSYTEEDKRRMLVRMERHNRVAATA